MAEPGDTIWIVSISGHEPAHFATEEAAREHLKALGAVEIGEGMWVTYDEDGDVETDYTLQAVVLR